jgi:hypothetical protein
MKISWIDWDSICSKKEVGGLGVRRIREFNLALLGKWCWWQVSESHGLWFRLLAARSGLVGGSCWLVVGRGRFGGER